jgi:hypothetical protein
VGERTPLMTQPVLAAWPYPLVGGAGE